MSITGVIVIPRPMLKAMQDNVVSFGHDPLELDTFARVLSRHALKVIDERLLAISDTGIVLDVDLTDELLIGVGGLALVEHQIVESHHRRLVLFEAG